MAGSGSDGPPPHPQDRGTVVCGFQRSPNAPSPPAGPGPARLVNLTLSLLPPMTPSGIITEKRTRSAPLLPVQDPGPWTHTNVHRPLLLQPAGPGGPADGQVLPGAERACTTTSQDRDATRTLFWDVVCPETRVTSPDGTPSRSAMRRRTARFARPSTAGAVTRQRIACRHGSKPAGNTSSCAPAVTPIARMHPSPAGVQALEISSILSFRNIVLSELHRVSPGINNAGSLAVGYRSSPF